MIIDSAKVGMESARLYKSSFGTRVSSAGGVLQQDKTGSRLTSFFNFLPDGSEDDSGEDASVEKDEKKDNFGADNALSMMGGFKTFGVIARGSSAKDQFRKLHELCIRQIFELLFGKRTPGKESFESEATKECACADAETFNLSNYNFMVAHKIELRYEEHEETSFSTKGCVVTSDGRNIDFNINVSMSRSFSSTLTSEMTAKLMKTIDPLVINLDTDMTEISDQSFYFDLDCDGSREEIKAISSASGYLALDRNGDGKINDGSELFGTKTGDGFADLAMYDLDGNGWIDEADEIFDKLKIWVKDEDGNDTLYTLKEKNVGALYLGRVDTNYSLTDSYSMAADALIRETGMFLFEDGKAGTLTHIDMVS